uniref:Uncharacterized protein n=1 Tax=Glossina austeni TaxID=7395 RepID=A0A1A9UI05_GLOAU
MNSRSEMYLDSIASRRLLTSCAVESKPNSMCKCYLFVLLASKTNTIQDKSKYCYRIKLNTLTYDFKRFSCNFFEELSVLTYRESLSTQLETFASESSEKDVVEMLQSLKMRKPIRI